MGTVLLLISSFLLGRAAILVEVAPFAIAFFAVIAFVRKEMLLWVGLALLGGSLTVPEPQTIRVIVEGGLFLLLFRLFAGRIRGDVAFAPLLAFAASGIVLTGKAVWTGGGAYSLAMAWLEAGMALILCLIFVQALPFFFAPREPFGIRHEQLICLAVLLASLMTGLHGWQIAGLALSQVAALYLILFMATVGGSPYGATVGVASGMILGLTGPDAAFQIGALAFSGLLAGLLKEGGKLAASLGLMVGSVVLAVYVQNPLLLAQSLWESLIAVGLFLLTPTGWLQWLSQRIPGTKEQQQSQREYTKKVRDVTVGKMAQVSDVFRELAGSFLQFTKELPTFQADSKKMMHAVAERTCAVCPHKNRCWGDEMYSTYLVLLEMMQSLERQPSLDAQQWPAHWQERCDRVDVVMEEMRRQWLWRQQDLQFKRQVRESRQLVAAQLDGVSRVMDDLADEMKRETLQWLSREEHVRRALLQVGPAVHAIECINLQSGNVRVEVILPAASMSELSHIMIAPLLSRLLDEPIAATEELPYARKSGYQRVVFASQKEYTLDTGVAMVAKGGDWLSGDSYSFVEVGRGGKFAVAVSDGMGNGERAKIESRSALKIFEQLLQSGMDEKLAIKSLNSVLNLRSADEVYATVDVALIDLFNAQTTFMKIGSMPSFIKRGKEIIPISANNLPIGILDEIEVDLVRMQLQADDLLVMMTDGVYEAPGYDDAQAQEMMQMIAEIEVEDAQCFADMLLEKVIRQQRGQLNDDMTVVVTRLERLQSAWASFEWHAVHRQERQRTVS